MQENPKTQVVSGEGNKKVLVVGELNEAAIKERTKALLSGADPAVPPELHALEVKEPVKPQMPKFEVKNRSRAQRIAKVLYGASARVWVGREIFITKKEDLVKGSYFGVEIGTEVGDEKKILAQGHTFTEALYEPVRKYIMGGPTYEQTKARITRMSADSIIFEFIEPALTQFPEYAAEKKKMAEKNSPMSVIKMLLERAEQFAKPAEAPPVIQSAF